MIDLVLCVTLTRALRCLKKVRLRYPILTHADAAPVPPSQQPTPRNRFLYLLSCLIVEVVLHLLTRTLTTLLLSIPQRRIVFPLGPLSTVL